MLIGNENIEESKGIFDMRVLSVFFCIIFLLACSEKKSEIADSSWIEITGRTEAEEPRQLIYRVKTPKEWTVFFPEETNRLEDTKIANADFWIEDGTHYVHIVVHSFPSDSLDARIPPMAQIHRWKGQFTEINEESILIKPQAHGGFAGFYLFLSGDAQKIVGKNSAVLAWAMQMDQEHYLSLPIRKEILMSV